MKNVNKLLIIAGVICLIIIIICTMLLVKQKKQANVTNTPNSINQTETAYSDTFKVEPIKEINKVYNLERIVNDLIENVHANKSYPEDFPYKESHIESIVNLGIVENLKKFYIENAYGVDISSTSAFYFVKGYLIYDDINNYSEDDIKKEEVKFTIQRSNYSGTENYLIETYETYSFKHLFEYDKDNISKTKVLTIDENNIDMYLRSDSIMYESISIDEEVPEVNLAYWYYDDYKNNKLFSDHNKKEYENTELFKYEGNMEKGFTLIDNNEKQIFIKPGSVPMEYEVEE